MGNTNSDLIGNLEASPQVLSATGKLAGRRRDGASALEVVGTDFDADGDTIKLASIPTNARIRSIKIGNDDLDGGAESVFNLGLYDRDGNIKDEDVYASLVSQLQTATPLTELANEARDLGVFGQRVFEDAGDSEDPNELYDVVMTQTAAVGAPVTGTVAFEIIYTIG